ncbi:hypothetical protein IC762_20860 [Bradyrhizobium genosp. L]|uniref:hypothetical protein n=1 Tax=Bradyrhizobium genosp. L TaxID=83637 RepID=UPI0018A3300F|nr:hypothetical protein [Bradyrhizobium genosp. L]QPF82222.1 hypothetical protein IC762_20860 [Bradyrhizobium genosp. L]
MKTLKVVLGAIAIVGALLSSWWWVRAASAKVLGKGQAGVGWGGTPVNVENEKGEILDFLETFKHQSRYNSRAALAAAVSALAAGVLFLLNMPRLPS